MKYTTKECKKLVDFACEKLDGYSICPETAEKIISDAVNELTEKQLISLELYVLKRMTYKQISVRLESSPTSARTKCMQAARHIRRVYEMYTNPECSDMIHNLDLPSRITHALYRAGYKTTTSISCLTEEDLYKVRDIGKGACTIIKNKLEELGLSLKPSQIAHNETIEEITVKFKMPKERLKPGSNSIKVNYDAITGEVTYIDSF